MGGGHGITPDAIAVIYHEWRNQSGFCHEWHESKRRQKFDSCKLVKFVAEKAGRIFATNGTN